MYVCSFEFIFCSGYKTSTPSLQCPLAGGMSLTGYIFLPLLYNMKGFFYDAAFNHLPVFSHDWVKSAAS